MAEEQDDIINLWQKSKQLSEPVEVDVEQAIQSRSHGTLFWIRVILTIEFWMNVALIPAGIYYYLLVDPQPFMVVFIPALCVVYLFYYQFLIRQIKNFGYTDDVRTGLLKIYRYLRFFLLHYKVVIWASLVIGMGTGLYMASTQDPSLGTMDARAWAIALGFATVVILLIGFFFNFLINLIYGRKIKRLKNLVKEFS